MNKKNDIQEHIEHVAHETLLQILNDPRHYARFVETYHHADKALGYRGRITAATIAVFLRLDFSGIDEAGTAAAYRSECAARAVEMAADYFEGETL